MSLPKRPLQFRGGWRIGARSSGGVTSLIHRLTSGKPRAGVEFGHIGAVGGGTPKAWRVPAQGDALGTGPKKEPRPARAPLTLRFPCLDH